MCDARILALYNPDSLLQALSTSKDSRVPSYSRLFLSSNVSFSRFTFVHSNEIKTRLGVLQGAFHLSQFSSSTARVPVTCSLLDSRHMYEGTQSTCSIYTPAVSIPLTLLLVNSIGAHFPVTFVLEYGTNGECQPDDQPGLLFEFGVSSMSHCLELTKVAFCS